MNETTQQPPNRYALVSSLYGPGTMACWYLTILSIVISWTLHPKKRKSGSIDVDFIAILTLPVVAIGHLISQTLALMHSSPDVESDQYAQAIAAIEAPFSVIWTFMMIGAFMIQIAVSRLCFRRGTAVAAVGIACLATECYVYFSSFTELGIRYKPSDFESNDTLTFSRSFVADFACSVIAILVILAACALTAFIIVTYMRHPPKVPQEIVRGEQGSCRVSRLMSNGNRPNGLQAGSRLTPLGAREELPQEIELDEEKAQRAALVSAWISLIYLPILLLLSTIPAGMDGAALLYWILTNNVKTAGIWLKMQATGNHFFPRSNDSFSELDQAVATVAGATILGFSIYSVIKTRYEIKHREHRTRVDGDRIELIRLNQGHGA